MAFGKAKTPVHFASQPRSARRISLDLSDEAFDGVVAYAVQTNPDGSFCDSVRELLLAAVTSDIQSAMTQSVRRQARAEASRIVRDALSEALAKVSQQLMLHSVDNEPQVNGSLPVNYAEPVNGILR